MLCENYVMKHRNTLAACLSCLSEVMLLGIYHNPENSRGVVYYKISLFYIMMVDILRLSLRDLSCDYSFLYINTGYYIGANLTKDFFSKRNIFSESLC